MNRNLRTTVLLCVVFMAVVTGAFVANVLRTPVLDEDELREQGTFVLPEPRPLAPKGLVGMHGEPFEVSQLLGRWTFTFFGYTSCPDICPITLSALAQVERKLAEEGDSDLAASFSALLVTVDPDRDDEATLARYVTAFSPRFSGARGDLASLADFASQLNAAFMKVPGQGENYLVDHTGNLVVINPAGEYHAFIRMPHDVDKILLAYRSLVRGYD